MDVLARALEAERSGLSMPWPSLSSLIQPVPGTLMIAMGAPGAGKSMFALQWAMKLGLPVRLISLDTDSQTQAARAVAILTDIQVGRILNGDKRDYAKWLREQRLPVRVLDTPLRPSLVTDVLEADAEYFGESPSLVVVDDVSKLGLGERDYTAYDSAFLELHQAARRHNAVMLALHHLHRGDSSARTRRVRLADGKYTGEYEAEIVLGLWKPNSGTLEIDVLKNRFGEDDPDGHLGVQLQSDPTRSTFREPSGYTTARMVDVDRVRREDDYA